MGEGGFPESAFDTSQCKFLISRRHHLLHGLIAVLFTFGSFHNPPGVSYKLNIKYYSFI